MGTFCIKVSESGFTIFGVRTRRDPKKAPPVVQETVKGTQNAANRSSASGPNEQTKLDLSAQVSCSQLGSQR